MHRRNRKDTRNFSLWYSGIIQQTGYEYTQTYQVEVVTMA